MFQANGSAYYNHIKVPEELRYHVDHGKLNKITGFDLLDQFCIRLIKLLNTNKKSLHNISPYLNDI